MAESMGGDVGSQVLQAVQGLSEQVKELRGEVKGLSDRMDRLEARVGKLEDRMGKLEGRMDKLEGRMDKLEGRMDKLEGRMETQYEWLQRLGLKFTETRDEVRQLRLEVQQSREEVQQARKDLGAEIQTGRKQLREQVQTDLHFELGAVRTEMMLGSRQMHDRIDRNNDALNLMISGIHRNTAERFEPVEQRLKALELR